MEGKVNSGYGGSLPEALGDNLLVLLLAGQTMCIARAIHPFHPTLNNNNHQGTGPRKYSLSSVRKYFSNLETAGKSVQNL